MKRTHRGLIAGVDRQAAVAADAAEQVAELQAQVEAPHDAGRELWHRVRRGVVARLVQVCGKARVNPNQNHAW